MSNEYYRNARGMREELNRNSLGIHMARGRIVKGTQKKCIRITIGMLWECDRNAPGNARNAPRVSQECTRNVLGMHKQLPRMH